MDINSILVFILIAFGLFGIAGFFLIRGLLSPRKISALQEQVKHGKTSQAIRTAKLILGKDPKNIDARYLLGKAYLQNGEIKQGLEEYKTVNQRGSFGRFCKEIPFRREITKLFLDTGNNKEAFQELLLLIPLEPYEASHYYQAGQLSEKEKKTGKAAQYYSKALKADPRHGDSWLALGKLFYYANRGPEARTAFQSALKFIRNNAEVYYYLGLLSKTTRNYNDALKAFEKAQRDPLLKKKVLIERGTCYLAIKDYKKAQSELERVLTLFPDNDKKNLDILQTRYILSLCYEHNRHLDKAIAEWEIIQSQKPNFRDVPKKLEMYAALRGNEPIKDFMTDSLEKFEGKCIQLVAMMDLKVAEYKNIPDGSQIIAFSQTSGQRRSDNQISIFFHILRIVEDFDLARMQHFYKTMRTKGIIQGYLIICSSCTRSANEYAQSHAINVIPREKLEKILQKIEESTEKKI